MYCRSEDSSKKTDVLSALHSPFDQLTWLILLLVLVSISFLPGLRVWRAADLIWALLAQPPQAQKFGLLMISLSIVMIPLQSSFTLGVMP